MKKTMREQQLDHVKELISKHDKFFEYSDDHSAYDKGRHQRQAILHFLITVMDMSYGEAELFYMEHTK
jgi:hypothetical protein